MPPQLLLLAQICTKSFVGWGFTPDLTGGAYSAPPDSLVGIGGGAPEEREGGWEGKRREGSGGKGKGGGRVPECPNPELASLLLLLLQLLLGTTMTYLGPCTALCSQTKIATDLYRLHAL